MRERGKVGERGCGVDGWALLTCPRHVGRKRFAYGRNPGDCVARRAFTQL
jgi:hypothetical protein